MCSTKNSLLRQRPKRAAVVKAAPVVWVPTKPRRRRKPRRKPKYLSLKLELSPQKMQEIKEEEVSAVDPPSSPPLIAWMPPRASKKKKKKQKRDPLISFPSCPEEDNREDPQLQVAEDQPHVALLFETATDGTSSALDGLLDPSSSEERDPLSPSLSCVYSYGMQYYRNSLSRQGCGTDVLLRTAMRCKEREAREEERWVRYSEVVEAGALKRERYHEEEDTSSNCMTVTSRSSITEEDHDSNGDNARAKVQQLVGLKLDRYQDILDAWSDKPPFCFRSGEDPQADRFLSNLAQIVPDLRHPVSMDIAGSVESLWRVPDAKLDEKKKEKNQSWKTGERQASVLRYKEKRQSRLFSKRIRYEVRKVNAELRPRLKGRFVKKNEGTRDSANDDPQQLVFGHEEHHGS